MTPSTSPTHPGAELGPPPPTSRVACYRPGMIDYADALHWQRARAAAVAAGDAPEALVLLQHPPTVTLGRHGDPAHLLLGPDELRRHGATLHHVERGGDITFHGPGQLVAYPILNLRARGLGPSAYVHRLETALLQTAVRCGITARTVPGRPGIWAAPRSPQPPGAEPPAKLAAIGVRVQRGVSLHGLALNVSTALQWFDAIVPCGLADATVTSVAALLAQRGEDPPSMAAVEEFLLAALIEVLDLDLAPAHNVRFGDRQRAHA